MQPLKSATAADVNLSLGLINLTVSVHAAVGEDTGSSLTTLCTKEHAATPVKQRLVCPWCANDDRSSFEMGRSVDGGFVVIPAEVRAAAKDAAVASKKQLTLTVHPADEVSSVLMPSGKSYYLSLKAPNSKVLGTYTLLARLIESRPDLAFMGKFTLSTATSIFQLTTAGGGTLVLRQMADAALVRQHPVIEFVEPLERQLELAGLIAEAEAVPFVEAVHGTGKTSIIADYAEANAPNAIPVTAQGPQGTVTDMTAVLEAMLAASAKKKAKPVRRNTKVKVAS